MDLISSLPQLKQPADQLHWGNLQGAALPLAIAQLLKQQAALYLLLVPDTPTALRLEQELSVFYQSEDCPLLSLPDWETLPYDVFSPHQDIISQRIKTLYSLPRLQHGIVIVPLNTALLRLTDASYLQQYSLVLKKGQQLDLTALRQQLAAVGYRAVDQVMEHGEFSARGSLLDLYPMGATVPYRIDFFDNDVDGIRTFDPDNQRSLAKVDAIELLPAREFPTDAAAIERVFTTDIQAHRIGSARKALEFRGAPGWSSCPVHHFGRRQAAQAGHFVAHQRCLGLPRSPQIQHGRCGGVHTHGNLAARRCGR